MVVVISAIHVCAPAVAVITNATSVIKTCKVIYTSVGYIMVAAEDLSHVSFLPLNLALFGEPILANKDGSFSFWSNITNVIHNLPVLADS